NQFVSPQAVALTASAEALLMVIAGGTATLLGPIAGAALVVIVKNVVSAYIERWNFVLGAIFVVIVVFMPEGLVPGARRLWRSRRGGRGLSRWSDRAAGGERRGAQALEIDRGHVEAQRAHDGVGELAVAAEVPANPPAPRGDAPVGVKLEGRLATVQRGADVV